MYKKVFIIVMFIPSMIAANLSHEQLKELATKELPTLTRKFLPKEKHFSELDTQKKQAENELKEIEAQAKFNKKMDLLIIAVAVGLLIINVCSHMKKHQ